MEALKRNLTSLPLNEKLDYSQIIKYNKEKILVSASSENVLNVFNSLDPFITISSDASENFLVSINASTRSIPESIIEEIKRGGQRIYIDQSLYKTSSMGVRYDLDNKSYFIYIDKTQSLLYFMHEEKRIYLWNHNENTLSVEINRLIKSLISIFEESQQQLMIHASGVVTSMGCTLFLGDSRNGKTTVLLDVLSNFSADMLSCDTTFLRIENDTLIARGWPSNFSVSVGTMYDYECLHNLIPNEFQNLSYSEAWKIYDKHVVDTRKVIKNAGIKICPESEVSSFIALNFSTEEKTGIFLLNEKSSIRNWIKKVYLGSKDTLYPNWHQFWVTNNHDIDSNIDLFIDYIWKKKIHFYQMNWAPSLHTLIRRTPELDCFYKFYQKTRGK